jgi:hypothetical protein
MEKAVETEEEEEPLRKHREKEFERNLNRTKHESGTKGAHPQHKKLDTSKKSESDDFRFV